MVLSSPTGGRPITFSLNEIETMGKRAARGAGSSWGLAEEAGKAVRWLTGRGVPGPEMLAGLLTQNDGKSYDELALVSAEGVWRSRSGRLCPLISGAALCDRAGEIAGGRTFELGRTACPGLLVPFAADAAKLTGTTVGLSWLALEIAVDAGNFRIEGPETDLTAWDVDAVRCRRVESVGTAPEPGVAGGVVDAETWARLAGFERRTFAPATESSRRFGAGGELADKD